MHHVRKYKACVSEIQQWKNQDNVRNLFQVDNKDTMTHYLSILTL